MQSRRTEPFEHVALEWEKGTHSICLLFLFCVAAIQNGFIEMSMQCIESIRIIPTLFFLADSQIKKAVMKHPSQWKVWFLVFHCVLLRFDADGAIVPPPWSDPSKNPCASMPGGWQLLYWPPLKQCFKIFTVSLPFGLSSGRIFIRIHSHRSGIRVRRRWS